MNQKGNPVYKLWLIIRCSPLGFSGITFCVLVRFWCPIAKMKATDKPLHMLLDLSKNIYFSKSYSRKLFVVKKTQLDFQKKIFSKKIKNNQNFDFSKITFSIFLLKREWKFEILKTQILDFMKSVLRKNACTKWHWR